MLTLIGIAAGELSRWTWTVPGIGGLAYLTLFGSCLAYGSYVWLIGKTTPARLGTIAYVNPVIAALLGWWILDETLTAAQITGAAIIVAGVMLVSLRGR
jgi:drug/metabolite transporter (DMT)-like permease